jgi:hypothetical protein
MGARLKPIVASAMLVLYSGMMLLGPSLHAMMGCEHDHVSVELVGRVEDRSPIEGSFAASSGEQHLHDGDSCPICRFQAQGQLAPTLPAGELRQFIATKVPLNTPPVFSVGVRNFYSPRGPPSV